MTASSMHLAFGDVGLWSLIRAVANIARISPVPDRKLVPASPQIDVIRRFYNHPGFIESVT